MASYHLSVKTVSRATGRSGPGAAAYRTASLIQCERDGTTHDYRRRAGVEASFIVAPPGADWAQDRAALWNAVEAAEKRKDAKVAREYELALPHELGPVDRRTLAEGFAREVVARFGVVADVAIHAPHRHGDERNWHAHVLTTTRVAGAEGLGAKTRELDVVQTSGPAVEALRELWAVQVNHALERIQSEARVDHRSYARQGEDQVATQHMGPAAAGMERKAALRSAERVQEAARSVPEPVQDVARALPASVEAPRPVQVPEAVQDAPKPVLQPMAGESCPDAPRAAVRPSAGVSGAGAEPVTRIGQRNAEIGERNRAVQAARAALDVARQALEGLERAAAAGRRWVSGLARGLGAQIAGEREERARQAEQQRQEAARAAERERIAAELSQREAEQAKPAVTQAQRDAARQSRVWDATEEAGRKARAADQARLGPDRERQGPRMRP
jgi:hypothetical protein